MLNSWSLIKKTWCAADMKKGVMTEDQLKRYPQWATSNSARQILIWNEKPETTHQLVAGVWWAQKCVCPHHFLYPFSGCSWVLQHSPWAPIDDAALSDAIMSYLSLLVITLTKSMEFMPFLKSERMIRYYLWNLCFSCQLFTNLGSVKNKRAKAVDTSGWRQMSDFVMKCWTWQN